MLRAYCHLISPVRRALFCATVWASVFALAGCGSGGGGGTGPGVPNTGTITVTGDDVEMTGYIQTVEVGKKELLVYDRTVKLHPKTTIEGDGGIPLTFEDLIVGMWTEIDGRVDKSNGQPPPNPGDDNRRIKVLADTIRVDTNDDGTTNAPESGGGG